MSWHRARSQTGGQSRVWAHARAKQSTRLLSMMAPLALASSATHASGNPRFRSRSRFRQILIEQAEAVTPYTTDDVEQSIALKVGVDAFERDYATETTDGLPTVSAADGMSLFWKFLRYYAFPSYYPRMGESRAPTQAELGGILKERGSDQVSQSARWHGALSAFLSDTYDMTFRATAVGRLLYQKFATLCAEHKPESLVADPSKTRHGDDATATWTLEDEFDQFMLDDEEEDFQMSDATFNGRFEKYVEIKTKQAKAAASRVLLGEWRFDGTRASNGTASEVLQQMAEAVDGMQESTTKFVDRVQMLQNRLGETESVLRKQKKVASQLRKQTQKYDADAERVQRAQSDIEAEARLKVEELAKLEKLLQEKQRKQEEDKTQRTRTEAAAQVKIEELFAAKQARADTLLNEQIGRQNAWVEAASTEEEKDERRKVATAQIDAFRTVTKQRVAQWDLQFQAATAGNADELVRLNAMAAAQALEVVADEKSFAAAADNLALVEQNLAVTKKETAAVFASHKKCEDDLVNALQAVQATTARVNVLTQMIDTQEAAIPDLTDSKKRRR
jgi:hypothetical protein